MLDIQRVNMVYSRNFCDYNNYYVDQANDRTNNIDFHYQRGGGIYSTLSKRYGVPVLKYLVKKGIYAGKDILNDITSGKQISKAIKKGIRKTASGTFEDLRNKICQNGKGQRKKPKVNKKKKKVKRKISTKSKSKRVKRKPKNKRKATKFDNFK